MNIVRAIAFCAVVGIILFYGRFLTKWADEDMVEKNQTRLMQMYQSNPLLQERIWKEVNKHKEKK